jgi:hypothetical protein
MDPESQRTAYFLVSVLLHRADGNHRARADVEGRRFKINFAAISRPPATFSWVQKSYQTPRGIVSSVGAKLYWARNINQPDPGPGAPSTHAVRTSACIPVSPEPGGSKCTARPEPIPLLPLR